MRHISIIAVILFLIDQLVKVIITELFTVGSGITIIKDFFSLTHVHNTGAAFSILEGNRLFLILITLLFIIAIYYFFIKNKKLNLLEKTSYGLLIGGILGNLFDRIFLGYVIDYLSFNIFGYDFPVFNLADCFIVIAVFLIIIDTWKGEN